MELNTKRRVNAALNTVALVMGVVAAILALIGVGNLSIILALLGIGLFSGALGDLIDIK